MTFQPEVKIWTDEDVESLAELHRIAEKREAEFKAASRSESRMGDDSETAVREAWDAYDALLIAARERAQVFKLDHIGRTNWVELLEKHPPRTIKRVVDGLEQEVNLPADDEFGVNVKTFPYALLAFVDPEDPEIRTIVSPVFESPAALIKHLDRKVAPGMVDRLWMTAFMFNAGSGADPKARNYSAASLTSNETFG